MKPPKTKIETILCLIDFKQGLFIDEKKAKSHGLTPMENSSAFVFYSKNSNDKEINFIVYPTGKVFLNGAINDKDIEYCFWKLFKKLKEIGVKISLNAETEIEIQNVLATANLKDYFSNDDNFEINLEKLALEENSDYEPKKFPAVFLKFFSSPADKEHVPMLGTAVVFKSGKILIGDVKSQEDADIILEKVIEKVK